MANLGHQVFDQTMDNILKRHDIPPAAQRKQTTSWKDFIRAHMAVTVRANFFTAEVLTLTYYVLFFIHLETRRVELGRFHAVPGSGVDGAAGAKHDHGGVRMPERLPLSAT